MRLKEKRALRKNKEMRFEKIVFECNICGFEHSIILFDDMRYQLVFDSIRDDKPILNEIFFGKGFYMKCHACESTEFKINYERNYKV